VVNVPNRYSAYIADGVPQRYVEEFNAARRL